MTLSRTYRRSRLVDVFGVQDPKVIRRIMDQEELMGLYDDLGLDPNMDRNSFTKEDAVKVFEKAVEELKNDKATAGLVNKLLDVGFKVLALFV